MDLNAMWYITEEEAIEAAKNKTKRYKEEFIVVKDHCHPNCYWADRKSTHEKEK